MTHSLHAFNASVLESSIKQQEKGKIQIGVHIYSVSDQKEIFGYKEDLPLNPASNVKVITSAVAFDKLGIDYQYLTPFYADSAPVNGVINNLYAYGVGDPSIVEERLWRIAKDIALRGIKEITGDIVIDQSYFDGESRKEVGDKLRAYSASLSAFAINYNSFAIVVTPLGNLRKVVVAVDPPSVYFQLTDSVNYGGRGLLSVTRRFENGVEHVFVKGAVSGTQSQTVYRSVSNPTLYAGFTLKRFLEQNGVKVDGGVREGPANKAYLLLRDRSKPLSLIIRDLNKYSNNFTAEMLLKTLGALKGVPGTSAKGVEVVNAYLDSLGVLPEEYHLENGSGLSRNNRVAARVLTRVLTEMSRQYKSQPEYLSSFAIAGVDGTVRSRLKATEIVGQVRVKTGTLNDASSLSGFIPSKSGKLFVFSIIASGSGAHSASFYSLQEKIALQIAGL